MTLLTTPESLRALYEPTRERSAAKELPQLDVHATRFIGLSPFVVMATGGVDGMDASPRGVLTTELAPKYDAPPVATAEMAADFGRPPEYGPASEVAPEFDVHAPATGVMPTYAATTEMAAQFTSPPPARDARSGPAPRCIHAAQGKLSASGMKSRIPT